MKRFPRAMPEALGVLGLVVLVSQGCAPDQSVKAGAPVLTKLTIVENGSTLTDILADTPTCATTAASGGACDPSMPICKLGAADWCRCAAGMDPTMGTFDCDPFSPTSVVIATFDRLLDTDPLDPEGGSFVTDVASLMATPPPPSPITAQADYSPEGTPTGLYFNLVAPFLANYRSAGPTIEVGGAPALETGATIAITLDKTKVLAKDGKTPFTGTGMLADGSLTFKTAAFSATITVPTEPPPPADAGADADASSDADAATASDAASDAATDAADAGLIDASPPEVGTDALASEAGTSDAAAGEVADASSDAAAATPAPTPGLPVGADMNMVPVTITFNNLVPTTLPVVVEAGTDDGGTDAAATDAAADAAMDDGGTDAAADAGTMMMVDYIQKHITITEDGADFLANVAIDISAAPKLTFTPTTAWAPGKTYVVTVDAEAADVLGDTLGMAVQMAFVMAN